MVEYLDNTDKKIEKGFYKIFDSDNLLYFTGKYDGSGFAIFEKENMIGEPRFFDSHLVNRLIKVDKKDVKTKLKNLKDITNWLEEKLKN